MKLDLVAIIRSAVYNKLEEYVKENKTGFAYIYLIMNSETKKLLESDSYSFYGVKIAISETLDFGDVIVK